MNLDMEDDNVPQKIPKPSQCQGVALTVAALALICWFEYHTIRLIQTLSLTQNIYFTEGIVRGTPLYRVFQNRLLGPYFIEFIALITRHPFEAAYKIGLLLLLVISTLTCYFVVRRITKISSDAIIWTAAYACAAVALQDDKFYLFDAIDLSVILIFAYCVLYEPNNLRILIPLFFVELLNRESAEFIALWIIIEPVYTTFIGKKERKPILTPTVQMVAGGVLLVFGVWWTHMIRAFLFKRSYDPSIGYDLKHAGAGEHWDLLYNLYNFVHPYSKANFLIALLFSFCVVYMMYYLHKLYKGNSFPIIGLLAAMLASVWTFGTVDETRVWLNFLPFMLLLANNAWNKHGLNVLLP